MQKIMSDNDKAKCRLTGLLRGPQSPLLFVGSGSSQSVGYPSWPDLLNKLREELIPNDQFPKDLDLRKKASFVYNKLENSNDPKSKIRQYHHLLRKTFQHGSERCNHMRFHRTLVQLPFCGVVTTNYDSVLESAIGVVRVQDGLDSQCHEIDLCSDQSSMVFEFLRKMSEYSNDLSSLHLHSVLHLHGYWKNPKGIILTQEDYKKHYGLRSSSIENATKNLDTLHRKVVWSLLTMYPTVFVGFSLEDPAFTFMLDLVKEDFDLPDNLPLHFAILGSKDDKDQQVYQDQKTQFLSTKGVLPVFYPTIENSDGREKHEALYALIEELATDLGISGIPSPNDISQPFLRP